MKSPKQNLLAGVLLAHPDEAWSKHLYEHMFGGPMPCIDNADGGRRSAKIVRFPKILSPERRKQILLAALEQDDA
jgi:hypothetical protein